MAALLWRLLARAAPIVDLWRSAPLAPTAFALTAGVFLDRLLRPPPWVLAGLMLAMVAMALANAAYRRAWVLLLVLFAGAARNASVGGWVGEQDISALAGPEYGPVRISGILIEGPEGQPSPGPDPLRVIPVSDRYEAVLAVEQFWRAGEPVPITGEVRVTGSGQSPAAVPGYRRGAARGGMCQV